MCFKCEQFLIEDEEKSTEEAWFYAIYEAIAASTEKPLVSMVATDRFVAQITASMRDEITHELVPTHLCSFSFGFEVPSLIVVMIICEIIIIRNLK
jgi:hypothetical protein